MQSLSEQVRLKCKCPEVCKNLADTIIDFVDRHEDMYIILDTYGGIGNAVRIVHFRDDKPISEIVKPNTGLKLTQMSEHSAIFLSMARHSKIKLEVIITFVYIAKMSVQEYMKSIGCVYAYRKNEFVVFKDTITDKNAQIHEELMAKMYHPTLIANWLDMGNECDSYLS